MLKQIEIPKCSCGADAVVVKKKSIWQVHCAKYVNSFSVCKKSGHPMGTKGAAVEAWKIEIK